MTKLEIIREIVTIVSILIKTDCDDILTSRDGFIAFLNEAGIRNEFGRTLNGANFKKLVDGLTVEEKEMLIEEFNTGYEDIYRYLEFFAR
ncbi:hypothetical protein fHeYen901_271 [Yersinia phage fHe-Yen9-01]|uniref:Anti-sigma 70 protein n=1 Tax=Yersinia phage fHe-Yen9-01 TaxID=1965363 RepID=A0A1V0DY15_9CAUD|nr:anti-sigma factor [Yersinia phage fHe-Yen9-01]ARB06044.1 hypothetical protein fHeYen901_271 [Yersinia phage fHe-Yen9-01]